MYTVDPPETDPPRDPVEIPYTALSAEALRGVVESFVLREGTEYGPRDFGLEEKVAQVMALLVRSKARVMFDTATETVTIVECR